ncbi:phosphatase PAP2 family protein [Roseateles sp. P5_E1]
MDSPRESYAWVKTVCDKAAAPALPPCTDEPSCQEEEAKFTSGDRPPFVAAAVQQELSAEELKTVSQCCDAHHLRLIAMSSVYGEWRVDPIYGGQGGISFEVIQFIGKRETAIRWLQTAEGITWRSNALHLALLKYELPEEEAAPAAKASVNEPRTGVLPAGMAAFPMPSWRSDYLKLARKGSPDAGRWLSNDQLNTLRDDFVEPGVLHLLSVGNELGSFPSAALTQLEIEEIRSQSSDMAALTTVAAGAAAAVLLDKPATMELLERIRRETRDTTFALKLIFNRGRPWDLPTAPGLAIQSGEPLFPAHAAYPAGHAVLAYSAAALMTVARPTDVAEYLRRAKQVSANRVKGGFHWPSDLEAGQTLAAAIVALLLTDQRMTDLIARVRREWP